MRRDEIADLAAFVVVAEERSFTKAAARLGMCRFMFETGTHAVSDFSVLREIEV